MKNHNKDAFLMAKRCIGFKIIIKSSFTKTVEKEVKRLTFDAEKYLNAYTFKPLSVQAISSNTLLLLQASPFLLHQAGRRLQG
jgi:hypothetical protein